MKILRVNLAFLFFSNYRLEKAFDLLDGTKQETHDAYSCIEMMKLVQSCLKIRNDIFKNSTLEELLR